MNWYWKVRIYNSKGAYATTYIKTNRTLVEIDAIQDFYLALTGCKMLLEGMSDTPPDNQGEISGFLYVWEPK